MQRILTALVLLALVATACAGGSSITPDVVAIDDRVVVDPDLSTVGWVAGVNQAGLDHHRTLTGNAVSSPLSIGLAFSLAYGGATGASLEALEAIFGFNASATHEAANAVDQTLAAANRSDMVLTIANRLFPDDDFQPAEDFVDLGLSHYGTAVEPVDTDADGGAPAADHINGWVSQRTEGLIPMPLSPSTVQGKELVVVNTVYFNGDWEEPFLAELTNPGDFTTTEGATVPVEFMSEYQLRFTEFVRLDDLDADAVRLPYQGGEVAMWAVLPRTPDGLAALESTIDADRLAALPADTEEGEVDLQLPKWDHTLPPTDLFTDWLCPAGLCPGAPFGQIGEGIFIDAAVHGARVIVDEEGTEAAAATALGFDESGPPEPALVAHFDHPFLWTVLHEPTGTIVFLGRVEDPSIG